MKQALRNLAALLCLLMLGFGSAPCMSMARHAQGLCSQCTRHQPLHHQAPACCDRHRQPSAVATITFEQPAQIANALPSIVLDHALMRGPAATQRIWPPPLLPRLKLRI
jgi:hypothetical protein